jgi:hypothetical protein
MPRFKTVGFTRCENGHMNLFDIRLTTDSSDVARAYALTDAVIRKCKHCKTTEPMTLGQVFGTKEILIPAQSTIWGYTCHCGERVEVARFESEHAVVAMPPASKTVQCLKGHSRTIQNREFPSLEHWEGSL